MTGLSLSRIMQRSARLILRTQMFWVIIMIFSDRPPRTSTDAGRSALGLSESIILPYPPVCSMARQISRNFFSPSITIDEEIVPSLLVRLSDFPYYGIPAQMLTKESSHCCNPQLFRLLKAATKTSIVQGWQ